MKIQYQCEFCQKTVIKQQSVGMVHRFCSLVCKSEWQRTQKPVDREWLVQKYIVEGLNCTQIAAIVKRNSKQVWNWIRDYGIETRKRGKTGNHLFVKNKPEWTPERREKMSQYAREARRKDGRVPYLKNGVHHLKGRKGADGLWLPKWKGGITPERQALYSSEEWSDAVKAVWKRDNAICQRCGISHADAKFVGVRFEIHHIVSFMVRALRTEVSNLALLCRTCHLWVHSNANEQKQFIRSEENA